MLKGDRYVMNLHPTVGFPAEEFHFLRRQVSSTHHRRSAVIFLEPLIHHQTMDATSRQRLQKALEEMNTSDFSDTTVKAGSLNVAFDSLRQSILQLSGMLNSKQKTRS
jgi:sugar diacid utilization regulator